MPINDPIRGKKVAPGSLAFEHGKATSRQVANSWQEDIRIATETVYVEVPADVRGTIARDYQMQTAIQRQIRNALTNIQRSQQAFEFDDGGVIDTVVTTGTFDPLGCHNQVLKAQGAYFSGVPGTGSCQSFHRIHKGNHGRWHYYVHFEGVFNNGHGIEWAQIGFLKNGVLHRVVWAVDDGMSGDDAVYINDLVMGGVCQINVEPGDVIKPFLFLFNGGSGNITLGAGTSVYAYWGGHRVACSNDPEEGVPHNGSGFTFT